MKKKQPKALPAQDRPPPDEWQFWDGEAPPLVEEVRRKQAQKVRVAKEHAARSGVARKKPERNAKMMKLRAEGMAPKAIAAVVGLGISTVNKILKPR